MLWVFFLHAANGVQIFELVKIFETCLLGVVSLRLLGLAFTKFLFIVEIADTES